MDEKDLQVKIKTPATIADALIQQAIDKNISIDAIEKLIALRKQIKEEYAEEMYYEALAIFQENCPNVPKEKKVNITTRAGIHYSYNYAPIEVVMRVTAPVLHAQGFSYFVKSETDMENGTIKGIAVLHHKYGHSETSSFMVPIDTTGKMNKMQQAESSLTYAKRIAFCNVIGILSTDDDTNVSEIEPTEKTTPKDTAKSVPKSSPQDVTLTKTGVEYDPSGLDFGEPSSPKETTKQKEAVDDVPEELWEVEEDSFGNPTL